MFWRMETCLIYWQGNKSPKSHNIKQNNVCNRDADEVSVFHFRQVTTCGYVMRYDIVKKFSKKWKKEW